MCVVDPPHLCLSASECLLFDIAAIMFCFFCRFIALISMSLVIGLLRASLVLAQVLRSVSH